MDQKAEVQKFFDKVVYYTPYEERYIRRTNLNAYDILKRKDIVLEDFDTSVAHLKRLYGAFFMMDMPQPELHACLIVARISPASCGVRVLTFSPRSISTSFVKS